MRIDLHAHSAASDGTDPPGEVVRRAARLGLDVVALTDHDTAVGWQEAAGAAEDVGIALVRGIEVSTRYAGASMHLLAYLPDPTYPPLAEALVRTLAGRDSRVPAVCARLAEVGLPLTESDVRRAAGDAVAAGRPHIADAMVHRGYVADRSEAFRQWLNPGRPAYVERYAAPLEEMVAAVAAAGGVPVLAHPWGRRGKAVLGVAALAELREAGLAGIEVDHQDHPPADRVELRAVARDLGLVVTGSSDYHGTGKVDHELGCNLTSVGDYERLLELAGAASRASGRPTPTVRAG